MNRLPFLILLLPLIIGIGIVLIIWPRRGLEGKALIILNQCHEATELLGSPIQHDEYVNWISKSDQHWSNATYIMAVAGPKGNGRFSFGAGAAEGGWQIKSAALKVGDKTIDAFKCSPSSAIK